ncbi:T9SS type A sorting domain-containing protein [bacterium]|nr:T9SS type A sorting domain-containing protein [bacterium]
MKVKTWFCLGVLVLIAATVLLASQPAQKRNSPGIGDKFQVPGEWSGRTLTGPERATIQQAIDNIRTPPPAAITYTDAQNRPHTVSCSTIAADLQAQLNRGAIEAETLMVGPYGGVLSDGRESTEGDQMNLDQEFLLGVAEDPSAMIYLEEVLVHERTHKTQRTQGTTKSEREIEAFKAGLVYKDSLGLDTTDGMYYMAWQEYLAHRRAYAAGQTMHSSVVQGADGYYFFLQFDIMGSGFNYFSSIQMGAAGCSQYSLSPTRPSDMIYLLNPPPLPPGMNVALVCGGEPSLQVGRIHALAVFDGQVEGQLIRDFGPPNYPPMFFYSLTRCPWTGTLFALDTVNQKIVILSDSDQDAVPDTIISEFACASWEGFESLDGMRGVDFARHQDGRYGLIVSHYDVHLSHEIIPDEIRPFLADENGDGMADGCEATRTREFVQFISYFQEPLPVAGDQEVQLFAPWNHTIQVWLTDSLVQNLLALLGTVHMAAGVDTVCPLARPLAVGEFIAPVDQTSGARPRLATRVGEAAAGDDLRASLPKRFALRAPYPNPFNATTTLHFDLPRASSVRLRIYDVLGRETAVLVDEVRSAGTHRIIWNAADLSSGIYFVRLEADAAVQTRKLLLVK